MNEYSAISTAAWRKVMERYQTTPWCIRVEKKARRARVDASIVEMFERVFLLYGKTPKLILYAFRKVY